MTNGIMTFSSQDVKLLTEDIAELKPTIFCAVPRVLERIYSGWCLSLHISITDN